MSLADMRRTSKAGTPSSTTTHTDHAAAGQLQKILEGLREVQVDGAPAQQDQARVLIEQLDRDGASGDVIEIAWLLIDAFRHDPYLWRG